MLVLLVLTAAIAAASADCDACVQNLCHSKKTLIKDFPVTHRQLAIDRTSNILYVQIKHYTVAFFLDESKMLSVDTIDTNNVGLAVDQDTQLLYSGDYSCHCIYAYKYVQGNYTKKLAAYLDSSKLPFRLHYEDTLYTINDDGSCGYLDKSTNDFIGYRYLENFKVTDMVSLRNATEWFFSSRNELYKFSWDSKGKKSWDLISDKFHILSTGKDGDVYFADDSTKVIYKLDRKKEEMVRYADYVRSSVVDFVFDKDENIVFLDHDDSVARWVPSGEACTVPHGTESDRGGSRGTELYRVDDIPGKSFLIDLVQSSGDVNNGTFKPADNSKDFYEVVRT